MSLFAGKYELGELLHRGAHYDVFAARRSGDDAALVVKHRHPTRDSFAKGFVDREAMVYARVKSSAMIPVVDYGAFDDRPFVVMERIVGALTLAESVAAVGPFPPRRALPLLYQLIRALDDVHRASMAHGDVRMQNVLLAPNGDCPPRLLLTGFLREDEGATLLAGIRADLAALGPILDAVVDPAMRPPSLDGVIAGVRDYFDARALLEHVTRSLLLDAPL